MDSYRHIRSEETARTIKNPGDFEPSPGSTAGDGPRALFCSDYCTLQVAPFVLKDGLNVEDTFYCTFNVIKTLTM